ncbi:hypothetical protein ZIOFF_035742 [Zingiber officinale]|uniref:Sm domain-containing protein n=1 Tax=Zingiber officinale TaxID=94328 RepID=A0A8J5GF17_ZINOF|nr:hypothetical protein ZIOFF_035742 [Zingiber officinale]
MSTGGGEKGSGGGGSVKTPADFLKSIRGRPVVVKLNSGVDYRANFVEGLIAEVDTLVEARRTCYIRWLKGFVGPNELEGPIGLIEPGEVGSATQGSWARWVDLPIGLVGSSQAEQTKITLARLDGVIKMSDWSDGTEWLSRLWEKTSILACLDGYMNIAMEQTEEYVNGQLKNKYGDAFIRGNNVLYISTSKRTLAEGA